MQKSKVEVNWKTGLLVALLLYAVLLSVSFIWYCMSFGFGGLINSTYQIEDFISHFIIGVCLYSLMQYTCMKVLCRVKCTDVKLKFHYKSVNPFIHCASPLSKTAAITSLLLPFSLLGFPVMIWGFYVEETFWIFLGIGLIVGSARNIVMAYSILKLPSTTIINDLKSGISYLYEQEKD
ncbi:metalloprotease family protein [Bacillus bombysepticus]|uniref:metalloprotease family protein n=1 Tax=Bacillus bombysepticus TaxID=658666 RepID=UPI0030168B5B